MPAAPAPPAQLGLVKRSSQTELGGGKLVHDALNSPSSQSIASADSLEIGGSNSLPGGGGGVGGPSSANASAKKVRLMDSVISVSIPVIPQRGSTAPKLCVIY